MGGMSGSSSENTSQMFTFKVGGITLSGHA
jgi:hypothetical protein